MKRTRASKQPRVTRVVKWKERSESLFFIVPEPDQRMFFINESQRFTDTVFRIFFARLENSARLHASTRRLCENERNLIKDAIQFANHAIGKWYRYMWSSESATSCENGPWEERRAQTTGTSI